MLYSEHMDLPHEFSVPHLHRFTRRDVSGTRHRDTLARIPQHHSRECSDVLRLPLRDRSLFQLIREPLQSSSSRENTMAMWMMYSADFYGKMPSYCRDRQPTKLSTHQTEKSAGRQPNLECPVVDKAPSKNRQADDVNRSKSRQMMLGNSKKQSRNSMLAPEYASSVTTK